MKNQPSNVKVNCWASSIARKFRRKYQHSKFVKVAHTSLSYEGQNAPNVFTNVHYRSSLPDEAQTERNVEIFYHSCLTNHVHYSTLPCTEKPRTIKIFQKIFEKIGAKFRTDLLIEQFRIWLQHWYAVNFLFSVSVLLNFSVLGSILLQLRV